METHNCILVYGRPGHYLQSLVAVLKTLPKSELFLVNNLDNADWDRSSQADLILVISDPDSVSRSDFQRIEMLKNGFPELRCVALVDNPQQSRAMRVLGADVVLSRGASAGELLSTIQRLSNNMGSASRVVSPKLISVSI
jgi:DNA-binding NarL/FixJ family response regulator